MISINHKIECCGCEACVQKCPRNCIELVFDEEGYRYPKINQEQCINCHLCEKACPYLNITEHIKRKPILTLAAKNKNTKIVENSSSGGVFYELAKHIIASGGYVAGAIINDECEVAHTVIEAIPDLSKMMGSKYVQSKIGNTYVIIERLLKDGKPCLFSGTPCQISGLKYFLKKDYPNLITVDCVCHGVPSPGIWKKYLSDAIFQQNDGIDKDGLTIKFRDKTAYCWSSYGMTIKDKSKQYLSQHSSHNPYIRSFITNNCLRPSCYQCIYKNNTSDITLGDFWGIDQVIPNMYDENGVSLVMFHTQKGIDLMPFSEFTIQKADYSDVIKYNSAIIHSSPKPITRDRFFKLCAKPGVTLERVIKAIAPIESELSLTEKLLYLPTRIRRFINRKFKI